MTDGMQIDRAPGEMFTLVDLETMRFSLPHLRMVGAAEPLRIHLTFDAAAVDDMLERLTVLRAQMQPASLLS